MLRQVTSRSGLPQSSVAQSGALTGNQCQEEASFVTRKAVTGLTFRWANFETSGTPSILNAGQYAFTLKASLVYGGVNYPIMWGSGRTVTLQPDDIKDSLTLSVAIPANATFTLRWFITFATAPTLWPCTTRYSTDGWNQFGTNLTDIVDQQNNLFVRQTNFMVLPPINIISDVDNAKSVEIFGDSISSDGSQDSFIYNSGYSQRLCDALGFPFLNNGASGNAVNTQVNTSTAQQKVRRESARVGGVIMFTLCGLATNDFASGRTDAQVYADMVTLGAKCKENGSKLLVCTALPRTNAANTAKNTTDSVNVWTYIRNLNTTIRNNNGVGNGYLDVSLIARDPNNIDLWRTDLGTPTLDGTHPEPVMHDALTTGLQTQAATITGIWKQS